MRKEIQGELTCLQVDWVTKVIELIKERQKNNRILNVEFPVSKWNISSEQNLVAFTKKPQTTRAWGNDPDFNFYQLIDPRKRSFSVS